MPVTISKAALSKSLREVRDAAREQGRAEGRAEAARMLEFAIQLNGHGPATVKALRESIDPAVRTSPEADPEDDREPNPLDAATLAYLDALIDAKTHHAESDGGDVAAVLRGLIEDPAELEAALSDVQVKAFDESKHPRNDQGRFIGREAIHAAKSDPALAEKLREKTTDPEERKKLDAALAGEHDLGRTKAGLHKEKVAATKQEKAERLQKVRTLAEEISMARRGGEPVPPEHFTELAEHLPHLTVQQLRSVRESLAASFWGRRRRDEMVTALLRHAKVKAEQMRAEQDAGDPLDFSIDAMSGPSGGTGRGPEASRSDLNPWREFDQDKSYSEAQHGGRIGQRQQLMANLPESGKTSHGTPDTGSVLKLGDKPAPPPQAEPSKQVTPDKPEGGATVGDSSAKPFSVGDSLAYTGRGANPDEIAEFRGFHTDPNSGQKMARVIFRTKSGPPFETSVNPSDLSHPKVMPSYEQKEKRPEETNVRDAQSKTGGNVGEGRGVPSAESADWRASLQGKKRWQAVDVLRQRQPHELTADEYHNLKTFDHDDYGTGDSTFRVGGLRGGKENIEKQTKQQYAEHLAKQHADATDAAFIAGKPVAKRPDWSIPQADYVLASGNTNEEHKDAVAAALADGKPVPPEVLADYPDLAPKAAPNSSESPNSSPAATPYKDATTAHAAADEYAKEAKRIANAPGGNPDAAIAYGEAANALRQVAKTHEAIDAEKAKQAEPAKRVAEANAKVDTAQGAVNAARAKEEAAKARIAQLQAGGDPAERIARAKAELAAMKQGKGGGAAPLTNNPSTPADHAAALSKSKTHHNRRTDTKGTPIGRHVVYRDKAGKVNAVPVDSYMGKELLAGRQNQYTVEGQYDFGPDGKPVKVSDAGPIRKSVTSGSASDWDSLRAELIQDDAPPG